MTIPYIFDVTAGMDTTGITIVALLIAFVVIDKATIWYGSINPLENIRADDSFLRFSDESVAERLLANAFR